MEPTTPTPEQDKGTGKTILRLAMTAEAGAKLFAALNNPNPTEEEAASLNELIRLGLLSATDLSTVEEWNNDTQPNT